MDSGRRSPGTRGKADAREEADAASEQNRPKAPYKEGLGLALATVRRRNEPLFMTALSPRDTGDEVAALQALLVLFDNLTPSTFEVGVFDSATQRAVATFQRLNGDRPVQSEIGHFPLGQHTLALLNNHADTTPRTLDRDNPGEMDRALDVVKRLLILDLTNLKKRLAFSATGLPLLTFNGANDADWLLTAALVELGHLSSKTLRDHVTAFCDAPGQSSYDIDDVPLKEAVSHFKKRVDRSSGFGDSSGKSEKIGTFATKETWDAIVAALALKWYPSKVHPKRHSAVDRVLESLSDRIVNAFLIMSAGLGLSTGALVLKDYLKDGGIKAPAADSAPYDPDDVVNRRVDNLQLPADLTDTEVLLWAAAPVFDQRKGVFYDTVLSRYALARHLFKGKLLLMDQHEATNIGYLNTPQRSYCFQIPDKLNGETLDYNEGDHGLSNTTLPDVLNLITRAPTATDQEVKDFLVWWYAKTFQNNTHDTITLEHNKITIRRSKDGTIESVHYTGKHRGDSVYVQQKLRRPDIPLSSAQSGFYASPTLKPLTGSNNRLLIWTGFEQPLTIPTSFMAQNGIGEFRFNGWRVPFSWEELAYSVRRYFEVRDKGKMINFKDYNGEDTAMGWTHFVDYKDPVIKRLVDAITKGLTGHERLEALRQFGQAVEYQTEVGVEVNRPAFATLLQAYQKSGGDCNNRSVFLATLLKAAGYRTALVYASNNPKKSKNTEMLQHLLVAVHLDEFKDLPGEKRPSSYSVGDERWVVVETGSSQVCTFGNSDCIPKGLELRHIDEVE